MRSIYQFEILQKSGTTNCIDKAADSIDEAWRYAEKQADPGIVTVRVRNPVSIGHGWHSLDKARKLEHIARTAPRLRDIHDALRADECGVLV